MADYAANAAKYPNLVALFDNLELGSWNDALLASGQLLNLMESDHSQAGRNLQGQIRHLQAVAMLELGQRHFAMKMFDDTLALMRSDNVPEPIRIRVEIDQTIASYANRINHTLPATNLAGIVMQSTNTLQEEALLAHADALISSAQGNAAKAQSSERVAQIKANSLAELDPIAGNRLLVLLGLSIAPLTVESVVTVTPQQASVPENKPPSDHKFVSAARLTVPYNPQRFVENYDEAVKTIPEFDQALDAFEHADFPTANDLVNSALKRVEFSNDQRSIYLRAKLQHLQGQIRMESADWAPAMASLNASQVSLNKADAREIDHIRLAIDMASTRASQGLRSPSLSSTVFEELLADQAQNLQELTLFHRVRALEAQMNNAKLVAKLEAEEAYKFAYQQARQDQVSSQRLLALLQNLTIPIVQRQQVTPVAQETVGPSAAVTKETNSQQLTAITDFPRSPTRLWPRCTIVDFSQWIVVPNAAHYVDQSLLTTQELGIIQGLTDRLNRFRFGAGTEEDLGNEIATAPVTHFYFRAKLFELRAIAHFYHKKHQAALDDFQSAENTYLMVENLGRLDTIRTRLHRVARQLPSGWSSSHLTNGMLVDLLHDPNKNAFELADMFRLAAIQERGINSGSQTNNYFNEAKRYAAIVALDEPDLATRLTKAIEAAQLACAG